MLTERRRYRSAEFGVNIATSVSPGTFDEIESLTKEFRVTKSEVVRRLVLRGLADYHRDGKLPAARSLLNGCNKPTSSNCEFK